MNSHRYIASCLAAAFLDGVWNRRRLISRAIRCLGSRPLDLGVLVREVLAAFPERTSVHRDGLTEFLLRSTNFAGRFGHVHVQWIRFAPAAMEPTPEPIRDWSLPSIASPARLADWLGLSLAQLDWFADVRGRNRRAPPGSLWHYTYHRIQKGFGRVRLLESPKPRLKAIQRRILHDLLDRVPAHDAAHGFRRGRSVLTFAAPHVGKAMVLRFDLRDFFTSIPARRARALFRRLGYPREVAHLLTGLCTHATPADAWPVGRSAENWREQHQYAVPHLPQGAPTSPALANLCAYRLDVRLSALAEAAGARYTRYADDLAFSGREDFARGAHRFREAVAKIVLDEKFDLNWKKARQMRPATQQRLAGVIVNVRPNVPRGDYERLKAILHNCRRSGPSSQNRRAVADFRAHLLGRIAHVAAIHPNRGQKLKEIAAAIDWER